MLHKLTKIAVISILSFSLIHCANLKNQRKKGTLITYEYQELLKFSDSIKTLTINGKLDNFDLDDLKRTEKPDPERYQQFLSDSISRLTYVEKLRVKKSGAVYSKTPFDTKSYKFIDSTGIYSDVSNVIENTYLYKKPKEYRWGNGQKDSIIHNIPVELVIGTNDTYKVKAWVTNELNKDLSPFEINYNNGFILAYTMERIKPEKHFVSQLEKVYPIKVTKSKQTIKNELGSKKMTEDEYKKYLKNRGAIITHY